MKQRIISGALLIPVTLIIIFIGGTIFNFAVIIASLIMSFEWQNIISKEPQKKEKYQLIGLAYISLPAISLIYLRSLNEGLDIIIYLFFIVWATDIAAYFTGKSLKGPKLAEKISPNKTIFGAIGGILAAAIIGILAFFTTNEISFFSFLFSSIFLSIISQIGDLFESKIKRKFAVKDSGNLIPGHGGLLDRLDGLLFAAPVFVLMFLGHHDLIFA